MTTDNVTYFVSLTFMSSERNQRSRPPRPPPLAVKLTKRAYICTQQQTDCLGAHKSLERKIR